MLRWLTTNYNQGFETIEVVAKPHVMALLNDETEHTLTIHSVLLSSDVKQRIVVGWMWYKRKLSKGYVV